MDFAAKFRFDGKRVLVVGGATGMGAAGAELALSLGAEVIVMDFAEVALDGVQRIKLNLAEQGSIEAALAQLEGPVEAVFACAGVAEDTPGIERINFVGHRHLIERLVDTGQLSRGASVCFISSSAGLGWEARYAQLHPLFEIRDFDTAAAWMVSNGVANYMGTKQAVCAYVAREAFALLQRGIRINAICPGPTATPLADANDWLESGSDYRSAAKIGPSTPSEQAYPMAFLCSEAASAITGVTLVADLGWFNAGLVHSFPAASPIAEYLVGRKLEIPARN